MGEYEITIMIVSFSVGLFIGTISMHKILKIKDETIEVLNCHIKILKEKSTT